MSYQHLYKALFDVCGFIAIQSDMDEILEAVRKDQEETRKKVAIGRKQYNIYPNFPIPLKPVRDMSFSALHSILFWEWYNMHKPQYLRKM